MAKEPDRSTKGTALRLQAEELLRVTKHDVAAMPVKDVQQLVYELQVHQIELEMQNEELRRAQVELEAARERYADLYDFSPAGYLTLDTSSRIVEANLQAGVLLGVNRLELIGQPLARFVTEEDRDLVYRHGQEVVQTGTRQRCEVQFQEHAGVSRWLCLESLAVHEEPGPITHWRAALLDITERKLAGQKQDRLIKDLTLSQQHFQALFNWTPSAVGISTVAEGRFFDVNEGFSRLTGYTREEAIGRTTLELGLWADPSERMVVLREIREQGSLHNREGQLRTKSGEIRSLIVSVHSILLGSTPCLIYLGHDITERTQTEEALKASERQFASFMDNLPGFAWIKDAQGRHLYANRLFQESLMKHGDWKEKTAYELWPPEIAAQYESNDQTVLASGAPLQTVERYVLDGEVRHALVSKFPIQNHKGMPGLMGGMAVDITERKRAEEAMREALETLDATRDGAFIFDPRTLRFSYVNEGAVRQVGYSREELLRMTPLDIKPEFDEPQFRAMVASLVSGAESALSFRTVHRRKDGVDVPVEINLQCVGVGTAQPRLVAIIRDITERKWAEEALRSSDAFTRAVLNSLSAHVCVLDKEGVIVTTNDAWKEFTQRHADGAFIFGNVSDNYLDHCRRTTAGGTVAGQAILTGVEGVLAGSEPSFLYEYACHVEAEACWFLMRVTLLKNAKGVVISHTDISQRVRMGLVLEEHVLLLGDKQKELESLAGKLIEAQEAERKRIARELHDDFNQRLAALSVELESMERAPIAPPKPVAKRLAAIRTQVGQLSDDLHDLAYRLHPSLLEHVGLEIAVRDHVAEFAKRTGLSVKFAAREVPKTLSLEVATNLFRVMQESLQNVAKHAQATNVTVRLSGSPKGVGLSVSDNGKGFDFEDKHACVKGLGLVSMQERARGLGGFLRIHSLPRNGTKVCAWIPHFREGA